MKFTGESGSCARPFSEFGCGERQRAQHDGIHDREDRGGRAGSEPEHEHDHQREGGVLAELADGDPDCADEVEAGALRGVRPAHRMAPQDRKAGFVQRRHRACHGGCVAQSLGEGRAVQVVEMEREFVHGRAGQVDPARVGTRTHESRPVRALIVCWR
jgi:hypothetical protein